MCRVGNLDMISVCDALCRIDAVEFHEMLRKEDKCFTECHVGLIESSAGSVVSLFNSKTKRMGIFQGCYSSRGTAPPPRLVESRANCACRDLRYRVLGHSPRSRLGPNAMLRAWLDERKSSSEQLPKIAIQPMQMAASTSLASNLALRLNCQKSSCLRSTRNE